MINFILTIVVLFFMWVSQAFRCIVCGSAISYYLIKCFCNDGGWGFLVFGIIVLLGTVAVLLISLFD